MFRAENLLDPSFPHEFQFGLEAGNYSDIFFSHVFRTSFSDYSYVRSLTNIHYKHENGFAIRVIADICACDDAPIWRQPSAGGGRKIRLAPPQWYRAPFMYVGTLEWRLFPKKMFGGVLFAEGISSSNENYWGTGVGARIRIPPTDRNNLRLDVGYGSLGWQIFANIGEQF